MRHGRGWDGSGATRQTANLKSEADRQYTQCKYTRTPTIQTKINVKVEFKAFLSKRVRSGWLTVGPLSVPWTHVAVVYSQFFAKRITSHIHLYYYSNRAISWTEKRFCLLDFSLHSHSVVRCSVLFAKASWGPIPVVSIRSNRFIR